MATYVLIHGASDAFYWHLVEPRLRALGHEVVAPELPMADSSAGFAEYADVVVRAVGDRAELVVVAQSMGGFTAVGVRAVAGRVVGAGVCDDASGRGVGR